MSRACVYVHVYVCMCTYVYVCMRVYVRMYACVCTCACVYHEYRIMCISILQIQYYMYLAYAQISHCMYLLHYEYRIVCMYVSSIFMDIVLCVFSILQISYCMHLVYYEYHIMCIQHKTREYRNVRFIGIRILWVSVNPYFLICMTRRDLVSIAVRKAIGICASYLISVYRVICIEYNIDILL